MDFHPIEWAKEHPAIAVAGVLVLGVAVYLVVTGGGASSSAAGGSSATGGLDDADYQALLASENASAQTTAAANAQASQQSYNLAANAQSINGQEAIDQMQINADVTEQNTAATIANNQDTNEYNLGMATLGTDLAELTSNNQTTVSIANISANENEAIANTNANVSITQANDIESLGVVESNNAANVQITASNNAASVAKTGSILGFLSAII